MAVVNFCIGAFRKAFMSDLQLHHPLDLAYAPRLTALHIDKTMAQWNAASAASRATLECDLDVLYGKGSNETLDIFHPKLAKGKRSKGVMIFIHGGYWRGSDKATNSFVANAICERGYTAILPNYALCPATTIVGITQQMLKACAWVYRNAVSLGSNRDQITISGHSAGGHLTAMMMAAHFELMANDLPENMLKAGLSISGLYDLTPHSKAPFLKDDIRLKTPVAVAKVSPITYLKPRATLHTVYGSLEPSGFADQDKLVKTFWRDAVRTRKALLGHDHFTILSELEDAQSELGQLMGRVLKAS